MKNRIEEFRTLDVQQLEIKIEEMRRELLKLRLSASTTHAKSFASDKNKLKKELSRALTVLREKQLE